MALNKLLIREKPTSGGRTLPVGRPPPGDLYEEASLVQGVASPVWGLPPVSLSRSEATKNLIAERSFASLRMTKGALRMTNEAACLLNARPQPTGT